MLEALRRIGEGRAAEVFELEGDRVLKVARLGAEATIEREAIALRAAQSAGAPVPVVHEVGEFDGRAGIVMSRARGRDMLSDLARRPWTLARLGAKLGRVHAEVHRAGGPSE